MSAIDVVGVVCFTLFCLVVILAPEISRRWL